MFCSLSSILFTLLVVRSAFVHCIFLSKIVLLKIRGSSLNTYVPNSSLSFTISSSNRLLCLVWVSGCTSALVDNCIRYILYYCYPSVASAWVLLFCYQRCIVSFGIICLFPSQLSCQFSSQLSWMYREHWGISVREEGMFPWTTLNLWVPQERTPMSPEYVFSLSFGSIYLFCVLWFSSSLCIHPVY